MERLLLDERPSALVSACAFVNEGERLFAAEAERRRSPITPFAHAWGVGMPAVEARLSKDGITVSVFGPEIAEMSIPASKINYNYKGTASADGAGMATLPQAQKVSVTRDQKVRGVEARGIPPRGRPV